MIWMAACLNFLRKKKFPITHWFHFQILYNKTAEALEVHRNVQRFFTATGKLQINYIFWYKNHTLIDLAPLQEV